MAEPNAVQRMHSNYLPKGGEVAWRGLSSFRNVTLYGFVLQADGTRVNDMFERYIGRPSHHLGRPVDVCAITDRVLILFLDSERHQPSGDSRGLSEGSHPEQIVAVVTLGCQTQPNPGPVVFAPYIYASTVPGWRAEREIFGYPQQLGNVWIAPVGKEKFPESLWVWCACS